MLFAGVASAETTEHSMQHGFVLAEDDRFASHLVASGHHSRQTEIIGTLSIDNEEERHIYDARRKASRDSSYFLFQAQDVNLSEIKDGQILRGHIVESKVGSYDPENKLVRSAEFQVEKVLLNIPNPFFIEDAHRNSANPSNCSLQHDSAYSNALLNMITIEKKHCCDTGEKPCWWKC